MKAGNQFRAFGMLIAGILFLNSLPVQGANYLKNISIQKAGDSLAVVISTGQPGEYTAFLTESKPERIVVDIEGVINAWTNKKFTKLPFKSVKAVRTSQFQSSPNPVTRVVFDIERSIEFRSFASGSDIILKFPVAEGETELASWDAVSGKAAPTARTQKTVTKTEPKPAPAAETSKQTSAGVKLESYPKRQIINYGTSSYRDPFIPLVGRVSGQFSPGIPALENLTLVGVLEDIDGNRALLEDGEGNGYILMPNDKVKNGYLVNVTERKAIFQVSEYGWTRTVALELTVPEIK